MEQEHRFRGLIARSGAVIFLILIPFLPLLLSFVEHSTLKSNHVESFCRTIGIHDELGILYEPVIDLLR